MAFLSHDYEQPLLCLEMVALGWGLPPVLASLFGICHPMDVCLALAAPRVADLHFVQAPFSREQSLVSWQLLVTEHSSRCPFSAHTFSQESTDVCPLEPQGWGSIRGQNGVWTGRGEGLLSSRPRVSTMAPSELFPGPK